MRQILISKKQSFSSLGYQISSCASKVYCSGGMHLNTVISELNGMAYKLHSKITKKTYFNKNLNVLLRDHTNIHDIF